MIRPNPNKVNALREHIPNPRFWEIAAATIEDLAFGIRSLRGSDEVGRRVCLSEASYAAAEKSEWRMALKI